MDCRARPHVLLARRLESVLCFVGDDKQKHTLNLQSLFAIMGFLDFLLVACHELITLAMRNKARNQHFCKKAGYKPKQIYNSIQPLSAALHK